MNADYASRELGVELLGYIDWPDTAYWAKSAYSGEWEVVPTLEYKRHEFHDEPGAGDFYDHTPAFSLGVLFSHIPLRAEDIEDTVIIGRHDRNGYWAVVWREQVYTARTPADALIKLFIDGYKRGWITSE